MEIAVTHRRFLMGAAVLTALAAAKGYAVQSKAQAKPPTTTPPGAEAAPTAADESFTMPNVRLALPPEFDDETAYVRSIADEAAKLAARAAATSEATTQADLLLAAANVILSRELERPCTRVLLGVADTAAESGKAAIAALDRADELLDRAGVLIKQERARTGLPGGWGEAAAHESGTLESFAAALRAVLSEPDVADGAGDRRAWSTLSALLEDGDRGVASAAALWQAYLRSRDEDTERALLVLEPALADPHEGTMPYAFFARLTRCRVLADRGGYATASALLMQIEERYIDWFSDRNRQPEALRAIHLVEMTVLQGWRDRLTGTDHAKARHWCEQRLKELRAPSFDADDAAVLRLSPVIPVVAPPPTAEVHSPTSSDGG